LIILVLLSVSTLYIYNVCVVHVDIISDCSVWYFQFFVITVRSELRKVLFLAL